MPQRCDLVNTSKGFPASLQGKKDPRRIVVVTEHGEKAKPWSDVVEGMAHLQGGAWDWIASLIEAGWHASRDGDALVLVWVTENGAIGRA